MSEKKITDYNNPKSSLADIILVIAKHLILILILTFVSVIIAAIYTNKTYKPKYVSTAKLFIPDEGGGRYELGRIASRLGLQTQGTMGFDLGSSSLYPDIVNSRTFGKIILDKEFYTKKYGKKLPLIAIFTYGDQPAPSNIDTLRIFAVNQIPNMVKFRMEMGFFIIDVTTNDPQFSKDFADTLLTELDKFQRKFKKHNTNETIIYIEQKIAYAKLELENSEEKLKHFRDRNRNINNSPSLLLTHERLQRDVEIQKGIYLTLKQQLELEKIEEIQKKGPFVQILDYPSLPIIASNQKKRSTYVIGAMVGFFLAIGLSFIIEYFRNNNKSEANKLREAKRYALESPKRIFNLKSLINRNN